MPRWALLGKSDPQAEAYLRSICRRDLGKYGGDVTQILFQRVKAMATETMAMVTQNWKMAIEIWDQWEGRTHPKTIAKLGMWVGSKYMHPFLCVLGWVQLKDLRARPDLFRYVFWNSVCYFWMDYVAILTNLPSLLCPYSSFDNEEWRSDN